MTDKPNLLIIMSDQHAPDAIGALGHPAAITPSLDDLVASGVSFRNAYCAYPMCTPSRASFMTGRLTPEHGVWELGTPLRSDMPTWAHALRSAGYTTSISGRMHFVGRDQLHGFARRVHPDIVEMPTPSAYGDWDKPQDDDHIMLGALAAAGPTEEPTKGERFDTAVTNAALEELSRLAADGSNRPWALMVGLYLPHFPYQVSRRYYDLYDGVQIPMPRVPPPGRNYEELVPEQLEDSRKWLGLTTDGASEEQVREARRCYYGMITCMDGQVGRLLAHLRQVNAAESTWVVYMSDHGDNMGEHGFWSKLNFYEDSIRVPLVIVPPGSCHSAAQCHAPVSLVDWMSTVLDLQGQGEVADFAELPGRSLLPLLDDPTRRWPDRAVLADYACDGTRVPMRMVRQGRWKASFAPGFSPALFDLDSDPHEWNDLGGDGAYREILEGLYAIACARGWDPESTGEEIVRHKRRLQYIDRAETGDSA